MPEIESKTKKQIMVRLRNGMLCAIPDKLSRDIDVFTDDLHESEMDMLIVIDGKEGTGKSRAGRVIATRIWYILKKMGVKNTFGPENIHFTTEDYIKSSENGEKFQINILDESREALNRRRSMSQSNVMFTNWLSENRDKQQVHILIVPAVHDIDSYISYWRMSLLIHMMKSHQVNKYSRSGYKLSRGYFRVYSSSSNLHEVIHNKMKYGAYKYPKFCKYQRKFRNEEVFTPRQIEEYKEKKHLKRKEKYENPQKTSKRDRTLVKLLGGLQADGMTIKKMSDLTGREMSPQGMSLILNNEKKRQEQVTIIN